MGGFIKSTPIHVMEAITAIENPALRREWITSRETKRKQLEEAMEKTQEDENGFTYIERAAREKSGFYRKWAGKTQNA